MKANVRQNPPKGYRWVRAGVRVRKGDKFFAKLKWRDTKFPGEVVIKDEFYIRRIHTTKKGRKKK